MSLADHEKPEKTTCCVQQKLDEVAAKNEEDGKTFTRWLTGESLGAEKIATYLRAEGYGVLGSKSIIKHRNRACMCFATPTKKGKK